MTEVEFIAAVGEFQELSKKWSTSRIVVINKSLAVPESFITKYLDLIQAINVLGLTEKGHPNYAFFDRVKQQVKNIAFYAGEKDSFGWVTGVMRVNNLEIVFG